MQYLQNINTPCWSNSVYHKLTTNNIPQCCFSLVLMEAEMKENKLNTTFLQDIRPDKFEHFIESRTYLQIYHFIENFSAHSKRSLIFLKNTIHQ